MLVFILLNACETDQMAILKSKDAQHPKVFIVFNLLNFHSEVKLFAFFFFNFYCFATILEIDVISFRY